MKLLFKISIAFAILFLVIIGLALYQVAPYGIVLMNRYSKVQLSQMLKNQTTPSSFNLKYDELNLTVEDTLNLKGWYIHSNKSSHATIIVLHGTGSCKELMMPTAKILADDGFNAVLFDLRGNGESGGTYCTYGYYEKNDISRIIDYLMSKDSTQQIGIYGNSLGGAIALQAMAKDNRIKCGIIESTFASLREVVSDYMKRMYYFGTMFLSDIALNRAADMAKFNPDDIVPELSAMRIDNPVFVAHGDKDIHINFSYGQRIFNNLKTPNKEWHLIQGADHHNLYVIGGQKYINNLLSFLHRNLEK